MKIKPEQVERTAPNNVESVDISRTLQISEATNV